MKLGGNLTRLDGEHRHEMRKALKKLRYQTEFFGPLFGSHKTARFIKQLKKLQDVFGYVNDVRMASQLAAIQKERRAGEDAARAAGYAMGYHEAQAKQVWGNAGRTWKKLEQTPCFWI